MTTYDKELIRSKKPIPTDKSHFKNLITVVDPGVTADQVEVLYHFAMQYEMTKTYDDKITLKTLIQTIFKFKIGGYGKSFYLKQ